MMTLAFATAGGGILLGVLLVLATLRFGVTGFLFMVAVIAALAAAILNYYLGRLAQPGRAPP